MFKITALRGSTIERSATTRIVSVTTLTAVNNNGKCPYTALVNAMSPAVAPPTSAGPPGKSDKRSRRRATVALPSARLPSTFGMTLIKASVPRRYAGISGLTTAYTPGVVLAISVAFRNAASPPCVMIWIGRSTALGIPCACSR